MTNRTDPGRRRRYPPVAAVLILAAAAAWTAPAGAADTDIAKGQSVAQARCARCHVVDRSGKAGWTNAPSFVAIANRPTTTKASLEAVIDQPHEKMVALPRGSAESRQLAAYIMSLRGK